MFMPQIPIRTFGAPILAAWMVLGLVPARAAVIVGPWLEGDTTTNVNVLVECDSAATMTVNYGTTTNFEMSAATSVCWTNSRCGSDFIHRITLTGLQSNTFYHYQLAGQGAAAADYDFATMPPTNLVAGITLAEAPLAVSNAAGCRQRACRGEDQPGHPL